MSSFAANPSFIIVGAGVFGASTAYHLAKTAPHATITLIDRTPYPCPLAASYDYQKIVRADYDGDKFYMRLALKAQHEWRSNPLYSQYFHQSGMVNIEGTGLGRRMVQNFKDLGVETGAEVVDSNELKRRYPFILGTPTTRKPLTVMSTPKLDGRRRLSPSKWSLQRPSKRVWGTCKGQFPKYS